MALDHVGLLDCRNLVDAAELLMRLPDAGRKPIVGVSVLEGRGRGHIDPLAIARQLVGTAEVCLLPTGGLTTLPKHLNVYGGAARIWFPGLDPAAASTQARDHPSFQAEDAREGDLAVKAIVDAILQRATDQPQYLGVNHRGRVTRKPIEIVAVAAAIQDPHRTDAIVVVARDAATPEDCANMARRLQGLAQVFILATTEDAERLTSALPSGLGIDESAARVWWPGSGKRSSRTISPIFKRDSRSSRGAFCHGIVVYVERGSEPLALLGDDGVAGEMTTQQLAAWLMDPTRNEIVVGIAPGPAGYCVDPNSLAERVGAAGRIVVLPTRPASARLAAALPDAAAAILGGIRLWLPGLTWTSSETEHPVFAHGAAWRRAQAAAQDGQIKPALIELAAEAVLRRSAAPASGDRSDVRPGSRQRIQRATQRELDRLGSRRHHKAHCEALRLAQEEVDAGRREGAVAAFTDACALILWSVRAQHGVDSPRIVFALGNAADGLFALGQACGAPQRAECFEQALAALEEALQLAGSLPDGVGTAAGIDLRYLRSKTAEMCRYVAQRRASDDSVDGDAAAASIERGLAIYDQAISDAGSDVFRAWALLSKARLVSERWRLGGAPRLATEEDALAILESALRWFTGGDDLDGLAVSAVGERCEADGNPLRLATALLASLADTYIETGQHERALEALRLLDGYGIESPDENSVWASLRRGQLEMDHGDFWAGVARLERELAHIKPADLGNRTKGQAVVAIQALADALSHQQAFREAKYYRDWASRVRKSAPVPATATATATARCTAEATAAGASPPTTATPTEALSRAKRSTRELARRIDAAVDHQDVQRTIVALRAASGSLRKLSLKGSVIAVDADFVAALCALRDSVLRADDWRPLRRADRDEHLPAEWFVIPKYLHSDLEGASLACLLLAVQFAEFYAPGRVPSLLRELVARAVFMHGHVQALRAVSIKAADTAENLGRWQDAVRSSLSAARFALEGSPDQTVDLARRASEQLVQGLRFLGLGYDRAAAIGQHERSAIRVVELMLRAGARSEDVFDAMDRSKGQVLMATRASVIATASDHDAARELRDAQLEELDQHLATRSQANADPHTTASIHRRVGAARRRLLRVAPDVLHAWADEGQSTPRSVLAAQTEPTAIIEYIAIDGQLYAAAMRTSGDGSVEYWSSLDPLASVGDVREAADAIWDDVLSVSWSVHPNASLEDGHDLLLGGADRTSDETLAAFCASASTLIVVPGASSSELAATARVPVHALRHRGLFQVEHCDVLYAPSAVFWAHATGRRSNAVRRALALGTDHAIDAPAECEAVREILKRLVGLDSEIVDDVARVRARLLARNSETSVDYDVIHIAAHGTAMPFPHHMESAIDFGDFRLTGRECLRSASRAHLVFVNSCSVGLQVGHAGDLYGIPFAVLGSGSGSALFASTPVEPAYSHAFAARYYEFMGGGAGRLHACCQAMRAAIADNAPPRAWAPYFFSGDPRPLPIPG